MRNRADTKIPSICRRIGFTDLRFFNKKSQWMVKSGEKHGAETFKNSADEFYTLYFDDDEAATAEVVSH